MAKNIDIDKDKTELIKLLQKTVQSCNINFLIGSGCSYPAITALGTIEKDIDTLYKDRKKKEADQKLSEFLKPFIISTKQLVDNSLDENHIKTLENYNNFLKSISLLLFERKSHIMHKQATVFSTNYDLFIEKTGESYSETIVLNDGFYRNPSLTNAYSFSPKAFFNTVSNTGNLYKYQVEIPSINLVKLHGSLNWQIYDNKIYQSLDQLKSADTKDDKSLTDLFTIILPRKDKFRETLLNQVYYDLLRIYSNELDKENTLLISAGFSFSDEHIFDLTKRALKNPTLRLIIFCYQKTELREFETKYDAFNNVSIIYSNKENIDFEKFNAILSELLPKREEQPIYKVEITESKDE